MAKYIRIKSRRNLHTRNDFNSLVGVEKPFKSGNVTAHKILNRFVPKANDDQVLCLQQKKYKKLYFAFHTYIYVYVNGILMCLLFKSRRRIFLKWVNIFLPPFPSEIHGIYFIKKIILFQYLNIYLNKIIFVILN